MFYNIYTLYVFGWDDPLELFLELQPTWMNVHAHGDNTRTCMRTCAFTATNTS